MREYMRYHRQKLAKSLGRGGQAGVVLARKHADIADEMLRELFSTGLASRSTPMLLGAVGSYGRRALGLSSDLDLCFIVAERSDAAHDAIEACLYPLWDAGISVDHQVLCPTHVVDDAQSDIKIVTEILDFRPLAGDLALMDSVRQRLHESVLSEERITDFIAQLEAHAKMRHGRYGDSVYLLEPDVKNGTGGLRDIDFALWAAGARFGTSALAELVKLGVLTAQEKDDTEQAVDFLWSIRNHLHEAQGRKVDRLTFAAQESVAQALGFADGDRADAPELQRVGEMVEQFMSTYYRHARIIVHVRDRILGRAKRRSHAAGAPAKQLGEGLIECEGGIGLADLDQLTARPDLAFRVYAEAITREMPVLSRTRDAIACATASPKFCQTLRDAPAAGELFTHLLCTLRDVRFPSGSILSELHDVGLLLAMVPEFAPVVGRVHHDLYHVYTVDVHSIAAVDRLRSLARGELVAQLPLASRLAAEVTSPRVLYMATLLHDVGKAIGSRDHAERGAEMAHTILQRFAFDQDEIEEAAHLIRHHLTMYMVAVRRDLADPSTIDEFLRDVRGREGLRELYLLTVADVSTTSPVAMTKWKRNMLDTLYRTGDGMLAGSVGDRHDRVARVRQQARTLWLDGDSSHAFEEFLASMPARYFLANSPAEVVAHAKLALCPNDGRVGVSLVPSPHDGLLGLCVVTEGSAAAGLCVVAGDRPGLLASITAAICANRFEIQAAQVNTRSMGEGNSQAVDLFWVRSTTTHESTSELLSKVQRDITGVLSGGVDPRSLVAQREPTSWNPGRTPSVETEVIFDHHASDHYTVIEVLTENRSVLLFTLASALHQLDITIGVAKISTEGKRAVDVFYAAEADGSKIQPGPRTEQVRAALLAVLTNESTDVAAAE